MSQYAVICNQVTKKYSDKFALHGLSMNIPKGKVTGILGPNGSGKSTLFKLMMGMTQPTNGTIQLLGETPGWRINREVAYLPDRTSWYANQSIQDVMNWAENLLPGFNRAKAEELLSFMKLNQSMATHGLSKGEEARMLLILCIARDVPLILLDEPFSGIDLISREKIISALIDLLSEGEQTVVLTTHEIYEAESLFDYVVFLEDGSVKQEGDAEDLRAQYGSMENIYRELYR